MISAMAGPLDHLDDRLRRAGVVEVRRSVGKSLAVTVPWWMGLLGLFVLGLAGRLTTVAAIGVPVALVWVLYVTLVTTSCSPLRIDASGLRIGRDTSTVIPWAAIDRCHRDKWILAIRVDPTAVADHRAGLPGRRRVLLALASLGAPADVIGIPAVFVVPAEELAAWLSDLAVERRRAR
ncbi:hypothetical protein BH11ACT8_BH11ACT8_21570 [soil metagenome]